MELMEAMDAHKNVKIQKLANGYLLSIPPGPDGGLEFLAGGFTRLSDMTPVLEELFDDKFSELPNPKLAVPDDAPVPNFLSMQETDVAAEKEPVEQEVEEEPEPEEVEEPETIHHPKRIINQKPNRSYPPKAKHRNINTSKVAADHSELTMQEERVMAHFVKCTEKNGPRFSLEISRLAEFSDVPKGSMNYVLTNLEGKGYIKWEKRRGYSPFFTVLKDI